MPRDCYSKSTMSTRVCVYTQIIHNNKYIEKVNNNNMVMVWAAVTADGRSPLVLIDREVKINEEYYWENVLKTELKSWVDKHFGRRP